MGVYLKLCQLLLVYHKGRCLTPPFFPSIVNNLPNITEGIDGDPQPLYMNADNTTVYVSARTYDVVVFKLNEVLAARLYTWCCENCFPPNPTKTEYTILLSRGRQLSTGTKRAIKMGDYV